MFIAVIGTGYVGLVAGACFADKGYDVMCVDIDEKKIAGLNAGVIPIYEPGLKEVVERAIKREHLTFTTDLNKAIVQSEAIFICVGTPEGADGRPNMTYVFAVVDSIANTLVENKLEKEFKVVSTKSTVPVGTGDAIEKIFRDKGLNEVEVASNPEFLKEGCAINDFVKPDRIVIGANSERARDKLSEIYTAFTRKSERQILMDRRSAELTKYAANSMLALRITFMNQLANLCELVGGDISHVRQGIGSDTRIGPSFLFPGPGYGGSCFPKDVKALLDLGRENDFPLSIMEAVDVFNQKQKHVLSQKVLKYFNGDLSGKTIGVWGLSFKPETDDVRESPSIFIINDLIEANAQVKAYDPEGMETFRKILDHDRITFCSSLYDAAKGCHCLIVVTDWNEFKMPNFSRVKNSMVDNVVVDGRNLYSLQKMKELGFHYYSLGRKSVHPE
jgi:UDPglucose 6-dehydrogenase